MISAVIGAVGTISKSLKSELDELEIGGRIERKFVQTKYKTRLDMNGRWGWG